MEIGLMTSYGIMCGVSEYSRSLARALRALGHRVTIFANFGGERIRPDFRGRLLPVDDEEDRDVIRCFDAPLWAFGGDFDFARIVAELRARNITTLIVSYQCGLFRSGNLELLLGWVRTKGIRTVTILHDTFLHFNQAVADVKVVTGQSLLAHVPGATLIPQGVPEVAPAAEDEVRRAYGLEGTLVATLGLGRTDYELVGRTVRALGWRFLVLDPTRACHLAGPDVLLLRRWLDREEMVRILGTARATVLWYPPIRVAVTSSAAHSAVAARRPVIVNRARWFRDLPEDVFIKVADERELAAALTRDDDPGRLSRQEAYIRSNSWTEVARRFLALCG